MAYRRVSVNGFGFGGANAHVILDATDSFLPEERLSPTVENSQGHENHTYAKKYLLVFSAHDETTLNRNIRATSKVANRYEISDLAYTLSAGRSGLQNRGFSISDRVSLCAQLEESHFKFGTPNYFAPVLGFVFTG